MPPETQIFDPHGDVVLILNRNTEANPTAQRSSIPVNMLVSSKHMILASPAFAKMLKGGFREGSTLESKGMVEIPLPDDEPDVFIILLNIIHGRTKMVPRRIDLVQLTKLSILVDKYHTHEVVGAFAEIWIENLKAKLPKNVTDAIFSWLWISWVFEHGILFKEVTEILIRMSDSEFNKDFTDEFPIPEAITRRIQYERREGAIASMLQAVQNLLGNCQATGCACKRKDGNELSCDAMVLGSLLQASQKARLWPFPEPPYKGFTVEGLKRDILAFEIKTLSDITDTGSGYMVHKGETFSRRSPYRRRELFDEDESDKHGMTAGQTITESITSMINSLSDKIIGLSIDEFK